jgi:hypothetical protein
MIHFDMQAPHGSRVYPTMTGIRIEIPDSMRDALGKWLHDEAARYDQSSTPPEEMMTCPKCGGELKMSNGVPLFCSLCHGAMQVSRTVGEGYIKSLKQQNTVVRQQQFGPPPGNQGTPPPPNHYDQLRHTINQQQHPVAVPLSYPPFGSVVAPPGEPLIVDGQEIKPGDSISHTVPLTDEGEFIGPIQQPQS